MKYRPFAPVVAGVGLPCLGALELDPRALDPAAVDLGHGALHSRAGDALRNVPVRHNPDNKRARTRSPARASRELLVMRGTRCVCDLWISGGLPTQYHSCRSGDFRHRYGRETNEKGERTLQWFNGSSGGRSGDIGFVIENPQDLREKYVGAKRLQQQLPQRLDRTGTRVGILSRDEEDRNPRPARPWKPHGGDSIPLMTGMASTGDRQLQPTGPARRRGTEELSSPFLRLHRLETGIREGPGQTDAATSSRHRRREWSPGTKSTGWAWS